MARNAAPSAHRLHPACNGTPDLVRRIFLNEMDARHRLLGQGRPPADEVDQRIIGQDRTRLGLQEQLGHVAICITPRNATFSGSSVPRD
jgi:hypothetical protein